MSEKSHRRVAVGSRRVPKRAKTCRLEPKTLLWRTSCPSVWSRVWGRVVALYGVRIQLQAGA